MPNVEVAVSQPAQLGECPVWSAVEQVLYWVDIDGECVHRFDPSSGTDRSVAVQGRPGALTLTSTPGVLLLGVEHELVWLSFASAETKPFVTLDDLGPGVRINDSRTDPKGRFFVGSMFENTRAEKTVGSLHRVEADGSSQVVRSNVGTANGLAFDPDRNRMYFADTPTLTVVMWDYDADTGEQRNERAFFDYTTVDGKPDGACVDADGCYWSASVRGWALTRITPEGIVDRRIDLPVEKPTMPAFGGPNLDTLYVTSISSEATTNPSEVPGGVLLAIDLSSEGIQGRLDSPFAGVPPFSS